MKHSQKFIQQRKFYMALPILAMPFITMLFWALGGGQTSAVQAHEIQRSGLNPELPGAHFTKGTELWDKFSLYEQAKHDSIKYEEARRNDPYYEVTTLKGNSPKDTLPEKTDSSNKLLTSVGSKDKYNELEQNEALVNEKIELLTKEISKPEATKPATNNVSIQGTQQLQTSISPDIDRLEKMMEAMSGTEANDPEMQQIESVLEKILDVQHPERVSDKLKTESLDHPQRVFPVQAAISDDNINLIKTEPSPFPSLDDSTLQIASSFDPIPATTSFYGLDDEIAALNENNNAIEAVIHDTQTLVSGATVKMRLRSDIYINGQRIEKDQFIYGTCAINGERLSIEIKSIRNNNSLLPVSLRVFDLDGMEGIYIPGAIARDVAKQSANQSLQDIQLSTMDNSLGVQAAAASVEAAKGLFSRKARLTKATVKAGYQILLKDTNQINQ